uniref:U5 small nuclear ribonucleoprotein 40 kDa protein n=1 Tax=Mesocestoides corti TaxID=53468 RepID=A0A5K3FLG7_MESCO
MAMDLKRSFPGMSMVPVPTKRTKTDEARALASFQLPRSAQGQIIPAGMPGSLRRTSSLFSPNMLLTGHESEVFCAKFVPSEGSYVVSAGFDRQIFLWETYGECENIAVMSGHGGAILDLALSSDGELLYSASSDKTLAIWDLTTCQRVKKIRGHQNIVNSIDIARRGPQMIASGSDDGTVRLWDRRQKTEVQNFQNTYQVLSVAFSDTAEMIFSGGIDNIIKGWDLRKLDVAMRLTGHTDTVTGLALSPDGNFLLSNAMDNTLRIWDVKPYAPTERCTKLLQGHVHTFEKNLLRCAWSPDGRYVTCGSGDRYVHVWDVTTRHLIYKLPGHSASVNETGFHPLEPILLSGGSDKKIFLGLRFVDTCWGCLVTVFKLLQKINGAHTCSSRGFAALK